MVQDDRCFQYRQRLFVRGRDVVVRRVRTKLGCHGAWYCGRRPLVERHGLEILRPSGRRRPRTPQPGGSRVIAALGAV